ncbi:MAG TPA: aminoglycoside phosphotransferase family protein [Gaiellaceae bacterium]|nr:aminoglycoside phosphotransferase family protein [Gaiellaceae bacterium]
MRLFGALRHPDAPRILLLRSDRAWRLPRVVAPDIWVAQADKVGDAFERRLGTRPWLLRQLRFGEHEAVFELELLDPQWSPPPHGRWVGRDGLDRLRLKDEEQRPLLDAYLDALERDDVPPERPPWARPGWLGGVRAWLEREAARLGHAVIAIEQVKQWSISAVLRVRTDGPDLWFKVSAPLPLFVDEAAVTAELAERFPGYVPPPLAVEAEHGWLLFAEFDVVGWGEPLETRCELFRRFAVLQRCSVPLVQDLLAAGCLDRRLGVLESQLDPLFADPVAIARLTTEETSELRRRAPELKQACRRLDAIGLPATLVHGDLHPGNTARLDGELAYFDWTDACIGHPLIDLHSLQWVDDESARSALLDAYVTAWDGAISAEAVELARIVTPLHHAVSYSTIVNSVERSGQSELDATHEFLREALARVRDWPFV